MSTRDRSESGEAEDDDLVSGLNFWPRFILAVLATWRITHLLASEDGPWDLIARFRALLGSGVLGQLMDCFKCLSLWVAAPMAFFVVKKPIDLLIVWSALSGAACLLERAGQGPVVIQPISQMGEEEVNNGMLRSETSRSQGDSLIKEDTGRPITHAG